MKRLFTIATLLLAAGWGLYLVAGGALSTALGARLAGVVARLGEGKVVSAAAFVHGRLLEAMWLATLLLAWAAVHALCARWRARLFSSRRLAWAGHAAVALICLNLWCAAAQRTVLFWGLFWQGAQTHNLTRFHIKLILAGEQIGPARAVLVGSSQVRAQIDEELLNSLLGSRLRATELHYPGNKAYDVFMMQPLVSRARPDYVIYYASEGDFHSGSVTEAVPAFLTAGALPDLVRRGGLKFVPLERAGYGVLGEIVPLFRLREVISRRVFGPAIMDLNQQAYDAALEASLATRAAQWTKTFVLNDESRFHQQALTDLADRCRQSGQHLILIAGELNPLVQPTMAPEIRAGMLTLMRQLAAGSDHVTLIEDLPPQAEADYMDLTHVNKDAQARFTRALAARLEGILAARSRPAGETLRATPAAR